MKIYTRVVISISCLLVGVVVAGILYNLRKSPSQKEIAAPAILVSVSEIKSYHGPLTLDLTGLVVPYREISVVSEVTGRVIYKAEEFRAGKFVKAGTVLMQVDQTDYDLDIRRFEADLEQTASSLEELEVEIRGVADLIEIAKKDKELQESEDRRKRNSNAFSQAELEQSERAVLATINALSTQVNRLSVLEQSRSRLASNQAVRRADLELAKIRRNRCIVTAPSDGVIISESVEQDGFVSSGSPIMVFEDTLRAEIRCNLRADQLEWLWRHATEAAQDILAGDGRGSAYRIPQVPVRVLHESGGEVLEWSGTLDRFDGLGVDDRTKTIPCRVVVPQPVTMGSRSSRALVRGMFVKLRIELPTEPLRALNQYFAEIPTKSVLPSNSVWLHRDGKLWMQPVQIVGTVDSEQGKRTIIRLAGDGLQLSDQVVVTPVGIYTPEMAVRIQDGTSNSADQETSVAKERTTIGADKTRLTTGTADGANK